MLKLLKRLNKKQIKYIFVCVIFVLIQVFLDLKIPDYMSNITGLVQTEGSQMNEILLQGFYMIMCAIGSLVASVITGYYAAYIGTSFSKDLRKSVFSKVQSFGMEEIKKFSTSSLITRTTNDITQIQMLIAMGLQVIIKAPIMAIWAITKIAGKSFEWSVLTAGAVGVLLLMIVSLMIIALPKFKIIQKLTDNINRIARENLKGIRVVKAYNAEEYQQNKFENANKELTDVNLFTNRAMAIMSPVMSLLMSGLSLGIYWIGAYLINQAEMMDKLNLFSDMVVFSSYAMQVIMAFMMLVIIFIIYPRSSVSAKRILEVLETDEKIKDGKRKVFSNVQGKVEFKNVSFKYPDSADYMLEDISFVANKGETIAFIGSTGSGKTTLINLIPRFYDATVGEVLIDGINVKEYVKKDLNNKIGYVPQKAVIFKGTVKSNVSYGKSLKGKPTNYEIDEAINVSQAEEFVSKMPEKYDSLIAQDGNNISGGQKQRLAIARAIARKPEIYIFDDSFSALDYKTDSVLRKELKKYAKDSTMIIVGQRIGTIKNADKIIVLDNGKIAGQGTHKELLNNCEIYKEIALSQLSKEEIENG